MTSATAKAVELYRLGNEFRREQRWSDAMNAYDEAAQLDPSSPAVAARQMLAEIMEFYCKDYYNP
ncbi:MAG: tetratricopeptide repeat protein [Bacteroidaceae bacterium]|nr:tetratricopeptide repeat protein [Bacteroidaceae bacterium]